MPTTTTRLGLAQPTTADSSNEYRLAITGNATTLDNAATVLTGTLANRGTVVPSPTIGVMYYATDNGLLYFYTGSAWKTHSLQPGWTAIPLGTSWTTASGAYTPSYQIIGGTVFLSGAAHNGTGGTSQGFFTSPLPTAIRPASAASVVITNVTASQLGILSIASAGTYTGGVSNSNGDVVSFEGASYRLA